jgi:hypothetical protein
LNTNANILWPISFSTVLAFPLGNTLWSAATLYATFLNHQPLLWVRNIILIMVSLCLFYVKINNQLRGFQKTTPPLTNAWLNHLVFFLLGSIHRCEWQTL